MASNNPASMPVAPTRAGRSLSVSLLRWSLALGAAISLLVSAGLMIQAYFAENALTRERLEDVERILVPSLVRSLWLMDEQQLEVALDGIATVPGVEHIRLVDEDGKTRERGTPLTRALSVHRFPLVFDDGSRHELGTLEISVGYQRITRRLSALARSLLLAGAVSLLGPALAFYFLFRQRVLRHLAAMASFVRTMRFDRSQPRLALPGAGTPSGGNELDEVATAIDGLHQRVVEALEAHAAQEAELIAHRDHLNLLVEARTQQILVGERRLRMIADNVPALISHIDMDRRFSFNSRAYERALGRPLQAITGMRLSDLYDAETWQRVQPHLDRAFAGERSKFELQVAGRTFEVTYVPEKQDDGQVSGVYGLAFDTSRLKTIEGELRVLAEIDALTGLVNRRHFEHRLDRVFARDSTPDHLTALFFLDLDKFKQINDVHGHHAGDHVLQAFAARLRASVRSNDLVARLAGDEFVILLERLHSVAEAARVADTIIAAMMEPVSWNDQTLRMRTSIGIALRLPTSDTPGTLMRRADAALYHAKKHCPGGYWVAEPDVAGPDQAA